MDASVQGGAVAAPGWIRAIKSDRGAQILSMITFFLGWQLIVPMFPTEQVPTPVDVANFMWDELRVDTLGLYNVYESFGTSLVRLGVGLAIAFAIGLVVGVAMGLSHRAEAFFHDFVIGGITIPHLIWALVVTMWLGFQFATIVIVVVLAAAPFVVSNVAEGVRDVPKDLIDMARAYHVSRSHLIRHVILPSLMPFLFAGFRYALSIGWKSLVLAEAFGSDSGAGWMLRFWYDAHRIPSLIGYAGFFVIFAVLVDQVFFKWLQNYIFRWRPPVGSRGSR